MTDLILDKHLYAGFDSRPTTVLSGTAELLEWLR